jgi:chemotaxis family two-component system sensor kinase Cph1
VPAAREAHVGGDWYDVFTQPDGSTVLVIGDVVGHDTAAAADMAQLRGLLRGIAYDSGDGPARVLSRLDAAVEGLGLGALATVLVARMIPEDDGRVTVSWSSAGHLPPVVVDREGAVHVLDGGRADLLIGVHPGTHRTDSEAALAARSTLVLYTDGLVERRDQLFDTGIERLGAALADLRTAPVEQVCDGVLARLVPDGTEDDVALVAVRLERVSPARAS